MYWKTNFTAQVIVYQNEVYSTVFNNFTQLEPLRCHYLCCPVAHSSHNIFLTRYYYCYDVMFSLYITLGLLHISNVYHYIISNYMYKEQNSTNDFQYQRAPLTQPYSNSRPYLTDH